MDFDLNQELGGDIWIQDVVAVDEGVDNRAFHEWDLNMDASSFVDQGEGEREEEGEGETDGDGTLLVSAPAVGDEFDSVEEAFQYWRLYGKQTGFGVCKRSNHRKGEHIVHYSFACTKYRKVGETKQL